MLISTGIDCLDPIDPGAGMDLAFIKEKYGKSICLKGNVDCAYLLTNGTVEETVEAVKNCIKTGGPGSGYIISSSNSIHSSVNPENLKAMIETIHSYRNYPLSKDLF
jgi:uroporphyrinogen decarboxylase